MSTFLRKLLWLAQRRRKEQQLSAELEFHLQEEAEEREAAGTPGEEARWAAQRQLGNRGMVQEETRAAWSWTLLEQFLQDVRYAARTMLRNPLFTAMAALSLALGIGANTAIYSFMDALLMRQLPVADPASLVVLKWHVDASKSLQDSVLHNISGQIYDDPKTGQTTEVFPYPAFEFLRAHSNVLSTLFAYRPARKLTVSVLGQAEIMDGEYVSGDFFQGLGLVPAAGRLIAEHDDAPGAQGVVVLSFGYAESRFGRATGAIGRTVLINNIPFTTIGVAPQAFYGVDPSKAPSFYLPLHADLLISPAFGLGAAANASYLDQHYYWIQMMGRLRPGITIVQARAALTPAFSGWVSSTVTKEKERRNLPEFLLDGGAKGLDNLRRTYSAPFYLLLTIVGLILAIACANIANLLLARATSRRREMAVRLSMGAGRWRVIRQLLTESLLLALLGGATGMLVAGWGMRFLLGVLANGNDNFVLQPELNSGVLTAALLLTVATGLLFGLAPALQATRVDPMPVLKETRAYGPRGRARLGLSLGRVLVILQMAICLLLLVGAGLFVRTLSNLQSLDTGFERENLLVFKVNAYQAGHRGQEILPFYDELAKRLGAIPGVRAASMANSPLIGDGAWGWPVLPSGKDRPENAPSGHGSGFSRTATHVLGVGPGFFATMRIRMIAGREFEERDRKSSRPVAIVNEAWVKVNLGGGNPVGRSVTSFGLTTKPKQMEIVGMVKNARYDDFTGDFPAIVYLPLVQNLDVPVEEMAFFLRTIRNPLSCANAVREIVRQADARVPVAGLTTQAAQIDREMSAETLFARLSTAFSMLALAIACVGLYGTTSYAVARRTGEIGIRMALGAPRGTVVWMVLRDVLVLAGVGLAVSLPLALAASRMLQSLLYGVKPGDPGAIGAAVAILVSAALAAGYLPARRASRIDAMTAIRDE